MKRAIVWFKTDLRLHDNETLQRAIAENDEVIPFFCLDENQFVENEFGLNKKGYFRTKFLFESLQDLDSNLRKLGSGLIFAFGKPEDEIIKIVEKYQVKRVYTKKEVASEEIDKIELVLKKLLKKSCEMDMCSTSTLYHPQDLPFSVKDIPDVFTKFRQKVEKETSFREVIENPLSIKSPFIGNMILPSFKDLDIEIKDLNNKRNIDFKGGETEGLSRINDFLFTTHSIANYKTTRNGLIGENYSSKFSPWLSLGCISPRIIREEIKKYELKFGENQSTYWLIFELIWRDYFRFMMKKHKNKYFSQNGIKEGEIVSRVHNPKNFKLWKEGKTGNDFIDANMLELKFTGFMSNRGRQNVASYLINELETDWRFGAAYFEEQLIDYDVCSNWGNWAYLAGVGNDPRGKRIFNIEKQAREYDTDFSFRKLWLT